MRPSQLLSGGSADLGFAIGHVSAPVWVRSLSAAAGQQGACPGQGAGNALELLASLGPAFHQGRQALFLTSDSVPPLLPMSSPAARPAAGFDSDWRWPGIRKDLGASGGESTPARIVNDLGGTPWARCTRRLKEWPGGGG